MLINVILLAAVFFGVGKGTEFEFVNKENESIWVALKGREGYEHLENGGFVLESGKSKTVTAPDKWSGWVWPRTFCDETTQKCLTGDCGNGLKCNGTLGYKPFTFAAFHELHGLYVYTISFSFGFNLPMNVTPILENDVGEYGDGGEFYCKKSSCVQHLNDECPKKYQFKNGSTIVGCHSPCSLYGSDQFCCLGRYNDPQVCRSVALPEDIEEYFKKHCPDGKTGTFDFLRFRCATNKFVVTFGTLIPVEGYTQRQYGTNDTEFYPTGACDVTFEVRHFWSFYLLMHFLRVIFTSGKNILLL